MKYLLLTVFSIVISVASFPSTVLQDVTYEELDVLGARCRDTCNEVREHEDLQTYACHCCHYCSDLNTCCIDSPYRSQTRYRGLYFSCLDISGQNYYVSNRCSPRWRGDPVIKRFCERGWTGQDDLMVLAPVTSTLTNVTYRNYFCFECNEKANSRNAVFWNVFIESYEVAVDSVDQDNLIFRYNGRTRMWMASDDNGESFFSVWLNIQAPGEISGITHTCHRNVISHCSRDWRNISVRRKCASYMAIVMFSKDSGTKIYRNPHCALCNGEDLEKKFCQRSVGFGGARPFSFALLLDINRSDGDKVGQTQRCSEDSMWDPYFKKCRTLECALPGQVVRNGKCTST